jgi:hypothetical protein
VNQEVQPLRQGVPALGVHDCPSFSRHCREFGSNLCPLGQLHCPAVQLVGQVRPQPPQLAGSFWKLTQRLVHPFGVLPEHWQVAPTQLPTEQLFA